MKNTKKAAKSISEKSAMKVTTQQSTMNFNKVLEYLAVCGQISRDESDAFIEEEKIEFECSCDCPVCHILNSGKVEEYIDDDGSMYYTVVPQYIEWREQPENESIGTSIVRPIGYVGVPHDAHLDLQPVFFTLVRLHGGPAPVRRYLPDLIKLVLDGKINPGKVFDLTLPLDQVAEGYRAMDERRAIKALLRP